VRTGEFLTSRKREKLFNIFKEWEMEKLNLIYCKHILGVTKLCTNIAVLSELGRYPLYKDLFMLKQLFMYWYYRLEDSPSDLLSRAYNEYTSSNNQSNNSWYINLLFFSEKLNINLPSIAKNLVKINLNCICCISGRHFFLLATVANG
jgi:hypothetical protein